MAIVRDYQGNEFEMPDVEIKLGPTRESLAKEFLLQMVEGAMLGSLMDGKEASPPEQVVGYAFALADAYLKESGWG